MRNNRKVLSGVVVSDKMQKTIVVLVNYYKKDPLYGKRIKKTNKFHVHDEKEIARIGDLVSFTETRPLSKTKKFRLSNIIFSKNRVNKI
ncbi:MAG: 30S ribosomal protein S17 [Candidatus Phytoplasma stylosanthis]|uniref:30S ribosomal protein S17 n=1 Tax=Candidatus Phytoplasma stylosanthis TaxID=2798314 RepID=UPI00293AF367|nr:30S ribosomal protein S17 [Candidatus Phytoplasma stylosanthis]MDV3167847.1 30S ribosomal protein S17 [Candidatus Phytoplasma stylosanthis]MDV3170877.1 30S ribosomal protein S17 [Candidatus Phytoplasma stylosanthis]MDV3173497.1 30S ribosomal protein S17 [Candidatus Phytoplasma stylosanthis]MDV3174057.1 30S ribosomal protein S17 [Candidatus Phytoplasma stylosanthis]MDV3196241.1 30S ribosomal protein S17 [Candidatus Phytoplasma stylosanthis]